MKKFLLVLLLAIFGTHAFAQFDAGAGYIATSLSGFNMNYNSGSKFHFNLDATAGEFMWDDVMLLAQVGYDHSKSSDIFKLGVGARYYIRQNGLHVGANFQYRYDNTSVNRHNNWFLGPEIGYTFYLNQHVTIEPALYYNMSQNNFSGDSEVGLRIGFGYFFNNAKK